MKKSSVGLSGATDKMNKKGQVVIDFLVTYGWVILAAIIILAILGYYVLSRDVYINPEKCLAKSICEKQGLIYDSYEYNSEDDSFVFCKVELISNVSQIIQLEINWKELKKIFPECVDKSRGEK